MVKRLSPLTLVICDWNGTLLDDLNLVYSSICAIFGYYKLPPPSLGTYRREITARYQDFYLRHGIPQKDVPEKLNAIRKSYFETHWDEPQLHPHTDEFLILLRQLRLRTGIVSAERTDILKARLDQFDIAEFFDHVIADAWDKEKALRTTLEILGALPEETAYVDDTYDGLMSAKNIGILPIGVTYGYNTPDRIQLAQPNPRYVGDSLADVMRIIEREVYRRQ